MCCVDTSSKLVEASEAQKVASPHLPIKADLVEDPFLYRELLG